MTAALTHHRGLHIAGDHPALPGHFPGAPLVPGVVLLEQVIAAAAAWLDRPLSVASLTQAKFNAPLLPGQTVRLQLQLRGAELRFAIVNETTTIAQGMLQLAPEPRV